MMQIFQGLSSIKILLSLFRLTVHSQEAHAEADLVEQHFIHACIACERSINEESPNRKSEIDWRQAHTWEEVLEQIEKAARSFDNTASTWGKVRKFFRSMGNKHQVFTIWPEILPSQSQYCSMVCGGLKLVFGVRLLDIV